MYQNRIYAGKILAKALEKYRGEDVVILAIPRGGIPVAYPVAKEFGFPLDIVLIKKIGHPFHREYAIGAVSLSDRVLVPHEDVPESYIEDETNRIREKLKKMYQQFKGGNPPENITGKTVIVIDDGIATGRTLASAVDVIRKSSPAKIVVAVPVAPGQAIKELSTHVDDIICPLVPEVLYGVGAFYEDFTQTSDEEVKGYLDALNDREEETMISLPQTRSSEKVDLPANITIPKNCRGLIIFAYGSGSSRLSTRNIMVARQLRDQNYGTVLFDLLTEEEDRDFSKRFNIKLLSGRLVEVTHWLRKQEYSAEIKIGYFGASTGAAAALNAAAELDYISAVVSRGGRPDLAINILHKVKASTLLIVGSFDHAVLQLNLMALEELKTEKKLEIVKGATHLFEESGTMDKVIALTIEWFEKYL